MELKEFDFVLPPHLIARFPVKHREESRLMVVDRKNGRVTHDVFKNITSWISESHFLVLNNSRVVPARFFGQAGEKRVEFLIVRNFADRQCEVLAKPAKHFKRGVRIQAAGSWQAVVVAELTAGRRILKFDSSFTNVLSQGYAPLPPYIKRGSVEAQTYREFDLERYQTVYARQPGSIAAPTAGLHFSLDMLAKIKQATEILEIALEVGEATFQKIEALDLRNHRMGKEKVIVSRKTAAQMAQLRKKGKKLLAVGTTTVRALETFALLQPPALTFESELFISPGFHFKMVDHLLTNFHLPKSSLFILVSAFAGLDLMKKAYRLAIDHRYRFFSYGDAMLIL